MLRLVYLGFLIFGGSFANDIVEVIPRKKIIRK
jgi:hypothetical protein